MRTTDIFGKLKLPGFDFKQMTVHFLKLKCIDIYSKIINIYNFDFYICQRKTQRISEFPLLK